MTIQRSQTNQRMSQCVIHGNTIYLAGQVANDRSADITVQTEEVLAKIDALLAEAGSDKTCLLSAQVWLTSIGHYTQMNEVWDPGFPRVAHRPGPASRRGWPPQNCWLKSASLPPSHNALPSARPA